MHITLVDDSIPFDGFTASSRPLGGPEKAFAALPGALARRGHTVAVFNRCRWGMFVEGVQWNTLDDGRKPLHTDVLVAFRKPGLLEFVRKAGRRVLWWTAPGRLLESRAMRELLDAHQPLLLLAAEAQAKDFKARGLPVGLMPAAVRSDFLTADSKPVSPPRAIVTTHPSHGLDWLLDLWAAKIRPLAPEAELEIHSMSLAKAAEGGEVDEPLRPLAAKVLGLRDQGVEVVRPQGDYLMAGSYRQARVHLYPGHPDDMGCFTLMESQACGCPAVVRPLGAAPERVANGRSAYVAPDDDAFANLAAMLLNDDGVHAGLSAEARALYQGRTWDAAAERFEAMLG